MKFGDNLRQIRKSKKMSQEQLAEKLFVSRTAVSKWESGKGYPSIDSLKYMSKLFSISIDNLLSSEEILDIAEQDKQQRLKKNNGFIFSAFDILSLFMIILPLYESTVNNYIYSVSLFAKNDLFNYIKITYLVSYIILFIIGIVEIILNLLGKEKIQKNLNIISLLIHLALILFFIMTKEPYACSLIFILFVFKSFLLFTNEKK